jgi:Tfp pilus assembly PilM family ATPase
MPRLLAIEWDLQEARYVVATTARAKLVVEQAGSIPLPQPEDGERLSAAALGEAIRDGLKEARAYQGQALLGVSRSNIELAHLSLPPLSDDELPDAVRYQARSELASYTEGALLDYLPLAGAPGEPRTVLAASLGREQFEQMQAVCAAASIKPTRLLVRPHAAGGHLSRQMRPREQVSLLVNTLGEDTDLTVLVDGQALLCRTVRLPKPAEDESPETPLLSEIRRTIFAVQNQPGGGPVSAVYISGAPREHRELVTLIQDELSLAAEVFQPFDGLKLSGALERELPANPGRFTALLGMLVDEAASAHAIDFLHPRRPPEPVSRKKLAMVAAAAGLLIAATGGYFAWGQFSEVGKQISSLEKQSRDLDKNVKRAAEKEAAVAVIDEWLAGDIVWLDELRDLSRRFPKPRDAVLLRMSLGSKTGGGGAIELEGLVRDPSIVGEMEGNLRDEFHEVRTKRVQESVQGTAHTWKFDSSLLVGARDKSSYESHLSGIQTGAPAGDPKPPQAKEPAKTPESKPAKGKRPAAQAGPSRVAQRERGAKPLAVEEGAP